MEACMDPTAVKACMDPTAVEDCRMPISAEESEAAAVVQLRDFMATRAPNAQSHASLRSPDGSELELPTSIYRVLVAAVAAMAQGNAISIVPVHQALTTQQAADLLNVSRPHLVKLLESDAIPYHKTGSHRRVLIGDLLRYRDVRDAERRKALAELTRKSAELGLDY